MPSINFANLPSLGGTPAIEIHYRYDADDNRVLKRVHEDGNSDDVHTAYIFDTLDLRRTYFDTQVGDYVQSANTEVPYLVANGVRLARVVYKPTIPASDPQAQHVFLELGDHLGSTTTVLDKRTGDLVEHATYSPYGATESDFRPDGEPGQEDWDAFREDYRFTGKEEDVEVGLTYFGKRFYSAQLQRWMSPDPLALHEAGNGDLNLYAYVSGMALKAVDPLGLDAAQEARAPMSAEGSAATGVDMTDSNYVDNFTSATWDGKSDNVTLRYLHGQTATVKLSEIGAETPSSASLLPALENSTYRGEGIATPSSMNSLLTPQLYELKQRIDNLVGWQLLANTSYMSFQVLSTAAGVVMVQQWSAGATAQAIGRGAGAAPLRVESTPASTAREQPDVTHHGLRYDARVRARAVQDPKSHNFPYSFDDAILATDPVVKPSGYKVYQLRGSMTGKVVTDPTTGIRTQQYKSGVYEIGVNKLGVIDHRFFRAD